MSNTFEILMDQLDMPLEMRSSSAFLHAEIQEVVVHKVSRVWEFRFAFAEVLPIALFKELRQRLKDEFSKTGDLYHPSGQSGFFCGFIAGLLPGGF